MFRSSSELPNPLDPAIKKATNETLTQDNWEYILDACDQVSSDPEDGAKNAILAIEKRLRMKDGNVLLRTLSLITALAENCGSKMKQEIATRRFAGILKNLVDDRHVYLPIKYKIVEMIDQLSKSFASDPSLRIISDTYKDIKLSHPDLVTSYKPQKPQKHEITLSDRVKEEEELDLALKLSLQEYESKQSSSSSQRQSVSHQQQQPQQQQKQQESQIPQNPNVPVSENNKSNIATVSRVRALYDLSSYEPDELSFKKGDVITVIESVYRDWWRGSLRGKIGIFPLNYVTPLKEPSTEELMEELKLEHLLLTKSNEVEKLLSLLSNFSTRLINNKVSNEELSSMVQDDQLSAFYKDVVSLRPQLAKLIEKYSTKKDEMIALNEKLVDSERLYNELMESSFNRFMNSRVQQQQQQQPPLPPIRQQYQTPQYPNQFLNLPIRNNNQQPSYPSSYQPQQQFQQQQPLSVATPPPQAQFSASHQQSPYQYQSPRLNQQQQQRPSQDGYVLPQQSHQYSQASTPQQVPSTTGSGSPYPAISSQQQRPSAQRPLQSSTGSVPPYPSYGI